MSLKDSINKIKRHARDSEKISAIKISGKRLEFRICEQHLQLKYKKTAQFKDSGRFDQILKRIYTHS